MADEIDQAQEREEFFLAAQIAARKPEGPAATGYCLTCEDPVPDTHRWCGPECRDDFEREQLRPHQFR